MDTDSMMEHQGRPEKWVYLVTSVGCSHTRVSKTAQTACYVTVTKSLI